MIEAIGRVHDIDRAACRAAAEQRFSMQRMARDYERLYRSVLCDPGQLRRRSAACATAAPDRREYCGTASQVQQ